MKIWLLSDLHIDVYPFEPELTDADLVIVAGDLTEGSGGIKWLRQQFSYLPVIYVPGNHEYYGSNLASLDAELMQLARSPVHVLQRRSVVIDGVRFLGCTLWTDFCAFGLSQKDIAMRMAERSFADFRCISHQSTHGVRTFTPADSVNAHEIDYAWLVQELEKPFDGKTVVVTHHAPAMESLHPYYARDLLSAGFISNLEELMGTSILWVHGHTHHSFDYSINGTRIICNPRGYASERGPENPDFNNELVIEV